MIWLDQDKLDDAVTAMSRAIKDGMREANSGFKVKFHVEDKMIEAAVLGAMVALTQTSIVPEGTMLVTGFGNATSVQTWPVDGGKAYRAHKALT